MDLQIVFLGTASGLPTASRFGQTIVLEAPAEHDTSSLCLLDPGDGASSLLAQHGFDHRQISTIFISHMHADHHAGLPQVLKTCMHLGRRDEITILAPGEGISAIQGYLDASYLYESLLPYPIRWMALGDCVGEVTQLSGDIRLQVYPNSHMAPFRQRLQDGPNSNRHLYESYSAVLSGEFGRLVYAGNLNGPKGSDELAPIAEPCDMLIMELAHVDPVELGRFLSGKEIGRTVITHFHPKWDAVSDEAIHARIISKIDASTVRGTVILARDGDRFVLG